MCRAITSDGSVRVIGVRAEEAAAELKKAHGLSGDAADIAAEGLVATALMAAHIKGPERMTLQIQSSKPVLSFYAEISSDGAVRGRLKPPRVVAPHRKLNGVLLAIKANEDRELYRGVTEVSDQTLTEALRGHLSDSAQIDSLLSIADGAGLLIERLPDSDGSHVLSVDAFNTRYGGLVDEPPGEVVEALTAGKLGDDEVVMLSMRSVFWQCRCSDERVLGMLATLDADTLRDMIETDGGAEVICHFCNHPYAVGVEGLKSLLSPN